MADTASFAGFEYRGRYVEKRLPAADNMSQPGLRSPALRRWESAVPSTVTLEVDPSSRSKPWLLAAVPQLEELLNLPNDWNGYGERPLHSASAKRFVALMEAVRYAGPEVALVPLADGGLQAEWHHPNLSVEITVPPVGDAVAWVSESDEEFVTSTPDGVRRLREVLSNIASE